MSKPYTVSRLELLPLKVLHEVINRISFPLAVARLAVTSGFMRHVVINQVLCLIKQRCRASRAAGVYEAQYISFLHKSVDMLNYKLLLALDKCREASHDGVEEDVAYLAEAFARLDQKFGFIYPKI